MNTVIWTHWWQGSQQLDYIVCVIGGRSLSSRRGQMSVAAWNGGGHTFADTNSHASKWPGTNGDLPKPWAQPLIVLYHSHDSRVWQQLGILQKVFILLFSFACYSQCQDSIIILALAENMKRHHRVAGIVTVFWMSFSLIARYQKENTVVLWLSSNPCTAAPTAHRN